jgi:hypothetical protein
MSGQASIVWPFAHGQPYFSGQQYVVVRPAEHFPDDLFRRTLGIDVGGFDQIYSGIEAHLNLPPGPMHIGPADICELAPSTEGHGSERQYGHP